MTWTMKLKAGERLEVKGDEVENVGLGIWENMGLTKVKRKESNDIFLLGGVESQKIESVCAH